MSIKLIHRFCSRRARLVFVIAVILCQVLALMSSSRDWRISTACIAALHVLAIIALFVNLIFAQGYAKERWALGVISTGYVFFLLYVLWGFINGA